MKRKIYQNKDWLHKKYIEEKLSAAAIGRICGVQSKRICLWLRKFDFKIKPGKQFIKGIKRTDEQKRNYIKAIKKQHKINPNYAMRGKGKLQGIENNPQKLRKLFDKYLKTRLTAIQFCKRQGYGHTLLPKLFKKHFPDEYELRIEQKLGHSKSYKKGRAFEYRIRNYFKSHGYLTWRSPKSGSPVDVLAIKKKKIFFIQCKSVKWLIKNEKEELLKISEQAGAIPILAVKNAFNREKPFSLFHILNDGYIELIIFGERIKKEQK